MFLSDTNMPFTKPRSWRFLRQMIFSPPPHGMRAAKARGMFHGGIEVKPRGVAAANHLTAAQQLLGREIPWRRIFQT